VCKCVGDGHRTVTTCYESPLSACSLHFSPRAQPSIYQAPNFLLRCCFLTSLSQFTLECLTLASTVTALDECKLCFGNILICWSVGVLRWCCVDWDMAC
jgi:hypothetical protein